MPSTSLPNEQLYLKPFDVFTSMSVMEYGMTSLPYMITFYVSITCVSGTNGLILKKKLPKECYSLMLWHIVLFSCAYFSWTLYVESVYGAGTCQMENTMVQSIKIVFIFEVY